MNGESSGDISAICENPRKRAGGRLLALGLAALVAMRVCILLPEIKDGSSLALDIIFPKEPVKSLRIAASYEQQAALGIAGAENPLNVLLQRADNFIKTRFEP